VKNKRVASYDVILTCGKVKEFKPRDVKRDHCNIMSIDQVLKLMNDGWGGWERPRN
jgi:hypothetical protein